MRFYESVIIDDPAAKFEFGGYDADTYIQETADDVVDWYIGATHTFRITPNLLQAPDGSASNGASLTIRGGNADGATNDGGSLTLKAGNAIAADAASVPGTLMIAPGNTYQTNSPGTIYFGDGTFNADTINLIAFGTEAAVNLSIRPRGTGSLNLTYSGQVSPIYAWNDFNLVNSDFYIGSSAADGLITAYQSLSTVGNSLAITGGAAGGTGLAGGNLYLYGGAGNGAGARGGVFLGDGSLIATLATRTAETVVVYYNTTTGLLSYGSPGAVGGVWTQASGYVTPSTAGDSVRTDGTHTSGFFVSPTIRTGIESSNGSQDLAIYANGNLVSTVHPTQFEFNYNLEVVHTTDASVNLSAANTATGWFKGSDEWTGNHVGLRSGNMTGSSGNVYMTTGTATVTRGQLYFGLGTASSSPLLENASATHVVSVNTSTGLLNWTAVGDVSGGVTIGSTGQIPYSNTGTPGTDFNYSANFAFASNVMTVVGLIRAQSTVATPTAYVTLSSNQFNMYNSSTQRVLFYPDITDGATAVGFQMGTDTNLTVAGAKILQLQNAGVEKFYVDKDGNAYAGGTLLTGGAASQWTTDTNGITYANNVGIGTASHAGYDLTVEGTSWLKGAITSAAGVSATTGFFSSVVTAGGTTTISTTNIEVNSLGTGNRYAYIDFHGDDTYTDYGLRIIRANTGANARSEILHRGTGDLRILCQEGSDIVMQYGGGGNVGIGTEAPVAFAGDGGKVLHIVAPSSGNDNPELVLERTTTGDTAVASLRITDAQTLSFALKVGAGSVTSIMDIDGFGIDVTGRILVSDGLYGDDNASGITIWGGNGAGSNIEMYGSTTPSLANRIYYNASVHTFKDHDGTPTYAVLDSTGFDVTGTVFATASSEPFRLVGSLTTSSPYISWYQTSTRRAYMQLVDTGNVLKVDAEYGKIEFWTGTTGTNETLKMTIHALAAGVSIGTATVPGTGYMLRLSTKGIGTDWTATSDRRLKHTINPATNILERIMLAKGLISTYIRHADENNEIELGYIAQDLLPIFPEIVGGSEEEMYNISYMKTGVIAMEGVALVKTELDQLREEVVDLKDQVYKLQNKKDGENND